MAAMLKNVLIEPDPVIEAYKQDVDRTLLRESLKLTPEERVRQFESFMRDVHVLQDVARKRRMSSQG